MLLARSLIFFSAGGMQSDRDNVPCYVSTAIRTQLLLYQTQRFQFANTGDKAEILCTSTEDIEGFDYLFSWHKRRSDETPRLLASCNKQISSRFRCNMKGNNLILEIFNTQAADSGLYFCADMRSDRWTFSNGTSLVVGDSYTPNTWVMLLLPSAHSASQAIQTRRLACVVHGVSNLVQVSWNVSGELQQGGQTLLAKNSSGSLTFISLFHIPPVSQKSGKLYTCEVRFNSSSRSVKKSATSPEDSSTIPDDADKCLTYRVLVAVGGVLASLFLLLNFLWIRLCPSRLALQGSQAKNSEEPPSSEISQQEDICYTHLDFASTSQDGNKRRQASQGKNLKQEDICYAHLDFASASQDGNKRKQASQGKNLKKNTEACNVNLHQKKTREQRGGAASHMPRV
ncbi:uncharacterized protein LOC128337418 isoform X4 [Hemicordylus capensis]|uniref:uncharacterized protein LOC128337418 isoform X4 n=1 Tax=Hemicordylus capensis TaxID=884348 RepID=UPI0023043C26|nr:uncharacterized protein LOC128337418 isoform X4 [Hemicordylus capensis]